MERVQFRVIQYTWFCFKSTKYYQLLQQRDNWGIDNFEIQANDPFYYNWSHISSTLPQVITTINEISNAATTIKLLLPIMLVLLVKTMLP